MRARGCSSPKQTEYAAPPRRSAAPIWTPFFQKYVAGTDEIPWDDFFKGVGLHLARGVKSIADPGFETSRNFDAALVVSAVAPGSAAERAGLVVGDSIVQINGREASGGLAGHSAEIRPGGILRLRVRNSSGERELHWTLESRQELDLELIDLERVTPEQRARRAAWLKGESRLAGAAQP